MAELDNGGRIFELAIRASRAMAERAECRTHAIGLATIKTPISASFRMNQRRDPFKIDTSLGRFAHEYRILAVCFLGFLKLLIDGIDCFIPAYLDELTFAALAHALHRSLQAILGINMGDLINATQADCAVAFLGQVARLDEAHAFTANSAFKIAASQAMELMAKMSNPFTAIGMRLGGREPAVRCRHTASASEANRTNRGGCFEKVPARHHGARRRRFRHLSPFETSECLSANAPLRPVGRPQDQFAQHSPILLR